MPKKPAAAIEETGQDDEEPEEEETDAGHADEVEEEDTYQLEEAEEEERGEESCEDARANDGSAEPPTKRRRRAAITAFDFSELLAPAINKLGRKFVTYDESKRVLDSKLDVGLVASSHFLLSKLHDAQPNLSFRRAVVYDGIKLQLEKHNRNWKLTPDQSEDFSETMCRRVLSLCRCVAQGCRKCPLPKWARALPWHASTASSKQCSSAAVAACSDAPRFVYGYDSFSRAAWRQPIGDAKASKELSVRWIIDGDDDDLAAPTAEWPDGHARRMTQLKVRDIRQMKVGRQTSADAATHWEEVHPETHHRIVIKNRADRGLLIAMMEQQQQICSVQVKLFTKAGEDESSEKARGRAAAVLIRIGEMYVSGNLASDELYAMRDTIYAEMGISGGRRNISKKPAAVVECRLVEGQAPPAPH